MFNIGAFVLDGIVPASDPYLSRPRLIRDASFIEAGRREIARRRGRHNRLGFAYQVAFVRVLGRFALDEPREPLNVGFRPLPQTTP